jgi:hypothetical protein
MADESAQVLELLHGLAAGVAGLTVKVDGLAVQLTRFATEQRATTRALETLLNELRQLRHTIRA